MNQVAPADPQSRIQRVEWENRASPAQFTQKIERAPVVCSGIDVGNAPCVTTRPGTVVVGKLRGHKTLINCRWMR